LRSGGVQQLSRISARWNVPLPGPILTFRSRHVTSAPAAAITATPRLTISAASFGGRSCWSLAERYSTVGAEMRVGPCGRRRVEEPDDRHHRLLRARRERPTSCRADLCDEFSPPHGSSLARTTAYQWHKRCASQQISIVDVGLGALSTEKRCLPQVGFGPQSVG